MQDSPLVYSRCNLSSVAMSRGTTTTTCCRTNPRQCSILRVVTQDVAIEAPSCGRETHGDMVVGEAVETQPYQVH